jgi:hypothetical protein
MDNFCYAIIIIIIIIIYGSHKTIATGLLKFY